MRRDLYKEEYYIVVFISIYILGTFIISIIGSITYKDYSYIKVFLYLIIVVVFIWLGFMFSILKKRNKYYLISDDSEIDKKTYIVKKNIRIVNISISISLILYSILFLKLLIDNNFDFLNMLFKLSVGDIYKSYLNIEVDIDPLVRIVTLFSVIPFIAMCGGVYYFKNANLHKKQFILFAIISILEEVLKNGQLAFIVGWVLVIVVVLALNLLRNHREHKGRNGKRKIVIVALVFLLVFGFFQNSRATTYNYSTSQLSTKYFIYNQEYFTYKILPKGVADILSYLTFYLSHGYYGLEKNLDTDFVWTEGYGNSKALSSYINQYLGGEDKFDESYPVRTESRMGYPSDRYWSTAFSWLAGDLSFFGIPIFMCLIILLYLKLYQRFSIREDFFSLILFVRISEFFFFIPATNYLMQTRANMIITLSVILLLIFSRFRIRKGKIYIMKY